MSTYSPKDKSLHWLSSVFLVLTISRHRKRQQQQSESVFDRVCLIRQHNVNWMTIKASVIFSLQMKTQSWVSILKSWNYVMSVDQTSLNTKLSAVCFSLLYPNLLAHWHIKMDGTVGLFGEQYINLCECLLESNMSTDNHENSLAAKENKNTAKDCIACEC